MHFRDSDSTAVVVPLELVSVPAASPEVLRRALRFGERSAGRLRGVPFEAVEVDLRAAWERRGERAGWLWVRAAVRAGYEQGADES